MAITDGIGVSVEEFSNGCWIQMREFESELTTRLSRSSLYSSSKGICASTGPFRFRVDADPVFLPAPPSNALRIRLNFDLGDQVNNYEIFVLYRKLESTASLGDPCPLPVMTLQSGRLTYYVESVVAPFNNPSDECWYHAFFEFLRLREDYLCVQTAKTLSEHHGRIRIDVSPIQISSSRVKDIPFDRLKNAKRASNRLLREAGITLEARLRFDLNQPVKPQIQYKCLETAGSRQHNFIFFHREIGHFEEIPPEQLEIIVARSGQGCMLQQTSCLAHENTSNTSDVFLPTQKNETLMVTTADEADHGRSKNVFNAAQTNVSSGPSKQIEDSHGSPQLTLIHSDLLLLKQDSRDGRQAKLRAENRLEMLAKEEDRVQATIQRIEQRLRRFRSRVEKIAKDKLNLKLSIDKFNAERMTNDAVVDSIFHDARQRLLEIHTTNRSKIKELASLTQTKAGWYTDEEENASRT